jgi:hypothetical protein
MAESLCTLLYADASKESYERALGEATSTSGFLRLAQEYKAAFGQTALNEQIRALVPDLEYDPSSLHRKLLQLPWTDVLTTNWDTLLERAALDVFDENYDVIRTHSEITSSTRPRIVKLHGTLPAHEPLIFTEDDYRTYPHLQAPFVNLVQQTLMESVLCLIGFSGDDPNFLHWSGWIRDNLGINAPKIYLVGWLGLTPSRKRMLEDRNVVPIDLSALPIALNWPKEHRHQYATEWFIESISVREKYKPEEWPYVNTELRTFPPHLGRIAEPNERLPKSEPFGPTGTGSFYTNAIEVEALASTWRWNRDMYPNWAIAPRAVRQRIWMHTFSWIHPLIRIQSTINPYDFLKILEELNWRLDLSLAPHIPEIQQPTMDCLNCFNFSEQTISKTTDQAEHKDKIHWPDLRIIWTRVAMNLVRASRVRGYFDDAKKMLETIKGISSDILQDEMIYEKLLIMRDSADLVSLDKSLTKWDITGIDSIWAARKAGLLAGLGRFKDAENIVSSELATNRKNRRRDTVDYASYSREAWLLWMEDSLNTDEKFNAREKNFERRKLLVSIGCDVLRDFNELVDRLAIEVNRKVKPKTGFYRNQGQSFSFRNGLDEEIRTALEILQFQDKTGLPRSIRMQSILGPGLRLASTTLQEMEPYLSAIANIRGADAASDDKLDFWTRNRIASLPEFDFKNLYAIVFSEINFIFNTTGELYNDRWHRQLQVSFEVLARITIRISPTQAEQVLDMLLNLIRFERRVQDPTLASQLKNLSENIFLSCPPKLLQERMVDIFSAPLLNDGNLPEISELLSFNEKFDDVFHLQRDKKWHFIIDELGKSILSENEEIFSRAHSRIRKLKELNVLTPEENQFLSNQFWNIRCKKFTLWPMSKSHYPWANLFLPCTQIDLRNHLFKNIFLDNASTSKKFPSVGCIGIAQKILIGRNDDLCLSEAELAILKAHTLAWCGVELSSTKSELAEIFASETNFPEGLLAQGLVELISELKLNDSELEIIFQKVKSAFGKIPTLLRLLPYIANRLPNRVRDIGMMLRGILVSDDEKMIRSACHALCHWLDQRKSMEIQTPLSDDIIGDVSKIIGTRRMSGLIPALELGTWIVENGIDESRVLVLRDAEIGMTLLFEDAGYTGQLASSGIDVASVRVAVAKFALAIKRHYYDAPEIFNTIIESFAKDEIVEVRNAALGLKT